MAEPSEQQREAASATNAAALTALYGTNQALPKEVLLRAGPLSMTLRGAGIVDLKVAGHEVWHGVAFLYRDPDWGTPEPIFQRVVHEVAGKGFSLRLEGYIPTQPAIDLAITVHGDAQGSLKIQARATPRGDLLANRIGLCLMHPMHAMGKTIEVEHVDGRISRALFPKLVPPWPPFTGVRGIRHEFSPGHWAQVRFQGDDFEFEDQRNNADASFKTYSRSNSLPRPYLLRGGDVIEQSLTLNIESARTPINSALVLPGTVHFADSAATAAMPLLGLAISPDDAQASLQLKAALAELSPSQLHLTLSLPDKSIEWLGIAQLLRTSGARLRLDLVAGVTTAALAQLAIELHDAGIKPESVALFPSMSATPVNLAAARLAFPHTAIGSGTPHFFAQLNRMQDVTPTDFLSFTVCPTVHSADDMTPMAGLQSLPTLLATARVRFPGRSLRIGPSSLGARCSPLGKQPVSDGKCRIALAARDPRTRGLYGAAWLLGHVAQAALAGAAAISVMSLRGDAGVVDETIDGRLLRHPSFFVLAQLARFKHLQNVSVSTCSGVAALSGGCNGPGNWIIANLTSQTADLTAGNAVSARVMDAVAWLAYVNGQAESPWRELRLKHAGVLQLGAFAIALM